MESKPMTDARIAQLEAELVEALALLAMARDRANEALRWMSHDAGDFFSQPCSTQCAKCRVTRAIEVTAPAVKEFTKRLKAEGDPRRFVDKFPPPERTVVFIDGGVAEYRDGAWYTGMEDPRYQRQIQWKVEWWMPLNPWPAAIGKGAE